MKKDKINWEELGKELDEIDFSLLDFSWITPEIPKKISGLMRKRSQIAPDGEEQKEGRWKNDSLH